MLPILSHTLIADRLVVCNTTFILAGVFICLAFFCSNGTDVRHLSVHLGKTAINDTDPGREQRFTVEKLIIHPHFDDYSNDNDIGVCSFNLCLMI